MSSEPVDYTINVHRRGTSEQGEAAFADAAQGAQQRVVGAVVNGESAPVGGFFDRGVHADSGAVVGGVGQGGQAAGGRGVQGAQGVFAGGGQIVHRAGLDAGYPDRQPVGAHHRLDVAAKAASLARVPHV